MRAALRPRLLVLVGLAAAAAAYNSAAPEPLNGVQSAALFTGFLTYKAGQLVRSSHLRPRAMLHVVLTQQSILPMHVHTTVACSGAMSLSVAASAQSP